MTSCGIGANNLVLLLNELEAADLVEAPAGPDRPARHLVGLTRPGRRPSGWAGGGAGEDRGRDLRDFDPGRGERSLHHLLARALAAGEPAAAEPAAEAVAVAGLVERRKRRRRTRPDWLLGGRGKPIAPKAWVGLWRQLVDGGGAGRHGLPSPSRS